jgi:hypothetical protein
MHDKIILANQRENVVKFEHFETEIKRWMAFLIIFLTHNLIQGILAIIHLKMFASLIPN